MILRFLIALPGAALLGALSFWSLTLSHSNLPPPDPLAAALEKERAHDLAGAERDLLSIAQSDRLYAPRWTLAGFYFRHDRTEEFWQWARQALAVGDRDLGALFDLCWRVTDDPAEIWRRVMPDRKQTWNEYLAWLLGSHRWDAAADVAGRLAQRSTSDDTPMLLGFCDLAIQDGNPLVAATVWNALCQRGLLPFTPIAGEHYLQNGDLAVLPFPHGFGWRLATVPGTRVEWTPGELHVTLSGNQPGMCPLAAQPLALPAGGKYRFTYRYRSEGIPPGSGVQWSIHIDGAPAFRTASLSSGAEITASLDFTMAPSARAANLVLDYERPDNAAAPAGTIVLRQMDIVRQ